MSSAMSPRHLSISLLIHVAGSANKRPNIVRRKAQYTTCHMFDKLSWSLICQSLSGSKSG